MQPISGMSFCRAALTFTATMGSVVAKEGERESHWACTCIYVPTTSWALLIILLSHQIDLSAVLHIKLHTLILINLFSQTSKVTQPYTTV